MALPPGLTPKTVTVGIASFTDGTLAEGTATITAPVNMVHTPTNRPIFSSQISKRFVDGEVSFDLLPTDAPGLNRVDWTYKLNVTVSGALVQPEPIWFVLPTAGPDEIDLDALVTVPSSAGTPVSVDVLTTADLPAYFEANPIAPSGGAGGALSGNYPNPGLNETAVENIVVNSAAVKGAFASAESVSAAYGLATRGYPPRTRPVEKMLGYFGKAGHAWTFAGLGSGVDDATQPMLGTQTIKLTPNASQSMQANSPTLTASSVVGRNIRLWFRYTGNITGLIIYLANEAALTNRVSKNVLSLGDYPPDTDHVVEVSLSDFATSGTPTLTGLTNIRLLAQAGAATGTAWIGGLALVKDAIASLPNGAVILSFDDTNVDHWAVARPKLAQYGMAATLYPNAASYGAGASNYTLAQARYMQDVHGFDVGSHAIDTAHHVDHVGQTEAWLREHFEQIIAANRANGFRGNSFAWPNTTSDTLARTVAADYFRSARGGNSNYNEVFPPLTPMSSRAVNAGSFTLAQLQGFVDRAKAGHSIAHFFFHGLPASKVSGNDVARADFEALVDYIAAQGVPVLTMSQFMDLPLPA